MEDLVQAATPARCSGPMGPTAALSARRISEHMHGVKQAAATFTVPRHRKHSGADQHICGIAQATHALIQHSTRRRGHTPGTAHAARTAHIPHVLRRNHTLPSVVAAPAYVVACLSASRRR